MYVQDGIPVVFRHLEEQVVTQYSCIVDQNIEASKMTCGLIHCVLYHGTVRHVTRKHQPFQSKEVNLVGDLLTPLAVDVRECNSSAFFSHAQCCRCSDASSCASDKSYASIKSSHTLSSPFLLQSVCIQTGSMGLLQYIIRIAGKSRGRATVAPPDRCTPWRPPHHRATTRVAQ